MSEILTETVSTTVWMSTNPHFKFFPKIGRTILNRAPLDRSGVNRGRPIGPCAPTRDAVVRNWPSRTISHNQESGMTLGVSQLPASTGAFRYSVSSEGSFDYLLFALTTPDALDTAATATAGPAP